MIKENNSKEVINESLHKLAKGGTLVFIGTILGLFLTFIATLLLIRTFSKSDYGVFSIAYAFFTIFVFVSTLGLKSGLSRNIALYKEKNEHDHIPKLIFISIVIGLISSLIIAFILFLLSEYIAVNISNNKEREDILSSLKF